MGATPFFLLVEFLRPNGEPLRLEELGAAFVKAQGIAPGDGRRPFRVALEVKKSRLGNSFFQYEQHGVPFPDGLNTQVRVGGVAVQMGDERPSLRGFPTREGGAPVTVGGMPYTTTVFITKGRTPYYVRVVVHKAPGAARGSTSKKPKGGQIVV
jgi:hypothetical protein